MQGASSLYLLLPLLFLKAPILLPAEARCRPMLSSQASRTIKYMSMAARASSPGSCTPAY